jgi:hypothetical protein
VRLGNRGSGKEVSRQELPGSPDERCPIRERASDSDNTVSSSKPVL